MFQIFGSSFREGTSIVPHSDAIAIAGFENIVSAIYAEFGLIYLLNTEYATLFFLRCSFFKFRVL